MSSNDETAPTKNVAEEYPPAEQDEAPWYMFPMYLWVSPLLARGAKAMNESVPLAFEQLLRLPQIEEPQQCAAQLEAAWAKELELRPNAPSLSRALWAAFKPRVIVGMFFRFLSDGSAFAGPFLLREFVQWLQDPDAPDWEGFVYATALALSSLLMSVCLAAATYFTMSGFSQMQHALVVMVFDSTFHYKHNHGVGGKLIAIHATDTARVLELALNFHGLWLSPILAIAATVAMVLFIGWAGLIAIGLIIVSIPLQGFLIGKVYALRGVQLKKQDSRVSIIDEVLQGIRVCKFMNWEASFEGKVQAARADEVDTIRMIYNARVLFMTVMASLPNVINFALFSIAYGLDNGAITPENVFPALSMLNVIRIPLMMFPMAVGRALETMQSVVRIQDTIAHRGRTLYVDSTSAQGKPDAARIVEAVELDKRSAVSVRDVTVLGDDGRPILEKVSVEIPRGKLTIVIGATASGKSSLVNAMIGEATVADGSSVVVDGSVAYVPQDAWIMNATVRENITFTREFEREEYIDALLACELMTDLRQLPASDSTAIGERGINLSGGQKQRVALARSLYSNRDLVFMDDPLSAVDPHVCRNLFDNCIVRAMAGKTRVLVTHQVQFLPEADHIVVMQKCAVVFSGTYDEYLKSGLDAQLQEAIAVEATNESMASEPAAAPKSVVATAFLEKASVEEVPVEEGSNERDIPEPRPDALETEETQFVGKIQSSTYAWYIGLGGAGVSVLIVVLMVLWVVALVLYQLLLAWWSTDSQVFGQDLTNNEFLMWFGIACVAVIALLCLRLLAYTKFLIRVSQNIHDAMMASVIRAPTSFFDTNPIGRVLNRFTKDVDTTDTKIPDSTLMVFQLLAMVASTSVLVGVTSPYLLILFPILAGWFVWLYNYYTSTVRGLKRLEGIHRSPMMNLMAEVIGGLASVRAYGMSEQLKREHALRVVRAVRPAYNTRMSQRWLTIRTETLGFIIVLATCMFVAATKLVDDSSWNVQSGSGVVALSISAALATTNSITFLTRTLGDVEADMASTERIKEYSDSIPQERDLVYDGSKPAPPAGWPVRPSVEFSKVELRYRPDKPLVLKQVSFRIEAGQRVGLVGRTGSGKSTVMLALFRMVEVCGGQIFVDGVDTQCVTLNDLREAITIIPQDPVLFAGTVRSNLDPFSRFSDDKLWAVMDQVGLSDRLKYGASGTAEGEVVQNAPFGSGPAAQGQTSAPPTAGNQPATEEVRGLLSRVSDKGSNFSVGQRQLMCLGRALLKRTNILLMDEATASVDFETDALIQQTVRTAFAGATVITIAHRLATVIDSDRIVVLDGGQLKEHDSPSALLADGDSQFYGMVKQLGDEQFKELKDVADGVSNFSDKYRVLAEKPQEDEE